MIITTISVDDLVSSIKKINNLTGTTTKDNTGTIFGSLMTDKESSGASGNKGTALTLEDIVGKIKNTEVSEQIKSALNNGEKVSLELNNPKDILATLLNISAKINGQNPSIEINQATDSVQIQELIDSLNIQDVVVDNQDITEILENFVNQLDQLLTQIKQVAEKNDIANIDDLKDVLTQISSQVKLQVEQIANSDQKEIQIDLSKIRLVLPEVKTEVKPEPNQSVKHQSIINLSIANKSIANHLNLIICLKNFKLSLKLKHLKRF